MGEVGVFGAPSAGSTKMGISVPSDWGRWWKQARANALAGTGRARIAVMGDSISQGNHTSSPLNKSFPGLIRIGLQSIYGDGGSGFFAMTRNAIYSPTSFTYSTPDEATAISAGWVKGVRVDGPAAYALQATGAYASDQTLSFGVRGNTISVFNYVNAGHGTYSWDVDGVSQGNVSAAGAATIATHTSTGFGPGHHLVGLTLPAGQPTLFVSGVDAYNASGVVVDNFGHGGATTADFAQVNAVWGYSQDWSGGIQHPCDCLIYALGVNDIAGALAADTSLANMATALRAVKSVPGGRNGATDIIVLLNHIGSYETAVRNVGMATFAAKAKGLCDHFGAALVNMNSVIGANYALGTALGYWGLPDPDITGLPGGDSVHLSDIGHSIVTNVIMPILTAA